MGRQIKLSEIMDEALEGLDKPHKANKILCYLLEILNAISYENKKDTQTIIDKYKDVKSKHPNVSDITENSLSVYLSILAKQEWSRICCPGKKQGYFLSDESQLNVEIQKNENMSVPSSKDGSQVLERDMYPYLEQWLSSEQYEKVSIIANKRGNAKWGNPDIIGINICSFLGQVSVEIATIEAKRDSKNWRIDIFEAVSHTLFANRSYYAYRRKETDKDDKDMIHYAHKFNIGIIAIIVPDDEWDKEFNAKNVDLQVIVPAPYQNIRRKWQKVFLKSLNINDYDDLRSFPNSDN